MQYTAKIPRIWILIHACSDGHVFLPASVVCECCNAGPKYKYMFIFTCTYVFIRIYDTVRVHVYTCIYMYAHVTADVSVLLSSCIGHITRWHFGRRGAILEITGSFTARALAFRAPELYAQDKGP